MEGNTNPPAFRDLKKGTRKGKNPGRVFLPGALLY